MKRTPIAGRVRQALREATMAGHQRVDDLFSRFALDTPESYGAFLKAHARALAPLEAMARPDAARLPKLAQDLTALGEPMPEGLSIHESDSDAFRWGALYALEGSRLGGSVLVRRVPDDLPRAYLSAVHGKGEWQAFQQSLDAAAEGEGDDWIGEAVQGAQAAFALFAAAASGEQAMTHG